MTGIPERDDPMWGVVPLPSNIQEIRPQQWDAIQMGVESFKSGNDVVFLQAPTGAGKSFIAEGIRRLLEIPYTNMVCTAKALQQQYVDAFPYGKVIMGKSNYLTELGVVDEFGNPWNRDWSAITCADCTWDPDSGACRWCMDHNECAYPLAKLRARFAPLSILNTSYYLTDAKWAGAFRGRGLTVLDEADLLERELLNQVEVEIAQKWMQELKLAPPRRKTPGDDGKGAVEWARWMHNEAIPTIKDYMDRMPKPWMDGTPATTIRDYNRLNDIRIKLLQIKDDVALGNWVYDGYDEGHTIFRPIRVEKWGSELLWPSSKKFLVMSATILSADLMVDDLGGYLPYDSITLDSTFPIENRPIYITPVADMSLKAKNESGGKTWRQMVKGILAVLSRHPGERVLVHTVSYELAKFLSMELARFVTDRPIVTYDSSDAKISALNEYKRSQGAVMLAASMDRGVDLPDDLCRVMAVAKIPFLNLGDKRVNARRYSTGGNIWYKMQAVRTLIQMTGRGVRHKDDIAYTYILDEQFSKNLWSVDYLFADYWRDAIVWRFTTRHLMNSLQESHYGANIGT